MQMIDDWLPLHYCCRWPQLKNAEGCWRNGSTTGARPVSRGLNPEPLFAQAHCQALPADCFDACGIRPLGVVSLMVL